MNMMEEQRIKLKQRLNESMKELIKRQKEPSAEDLLNISELETLFMAESRDYYYGRCLYLERKVALLQMPPSKKRDALLYNHERKARRRR